MNREDAPHLSDDRFNDLILALDTLRDAIKNLNEKNERLVSGPGGIMEMKQTIADKEQHIEKLEAALRTIYECCDETGNCSVVRRIVRKTLERKDD